MAISISGRALSRMSAHGVNVYPLEAFGILLGAKDTGDGGADILAALPVGKTERWHEPDGRLAGIGRALASARALFDSWEPRRMRIAWNRVWGILDYGNRHETELPRLGFQVPQVPQS